MANQISLFKYLNLNKFNKINGKYIDTFFLRLLAQQLYEFQICRISFCSFFCN